MGTKLFGVDIAAQINRGMGSGLPEITLRRETLGERDASNPTAGPAKATQTVRGRGCVDSYSDRERAGTDMQEGDRRISILGDSLSPATTPEPGDVISILGESVRIVDGGVTTDPARALFVCRSRAF